MPVFNNALAGAAGSGGAAAYEIERSLRFNSADSAYLSRTPASAGNRKTWTWAGWVKRSKSGTHVLFFGGPLDTTLTRILFNTEDLEVQSYDSSSLNLDLKTSALYRDFSAWLHCVISVDTTQATSSNRVRVYINGTQVTDFATATYPSQNYDTHINTSNKHSIGVEDSSNIYYKYDGYLADVHFIDGQALAATDFGEYDNNGVWQPIEYTGTYGTNGFHLDFSDNSSNAALGYDAAGSNDWTVNNLSVASGAGNDSLLDSPTNYEADSGNNGGNYCTWNPLHTNANLSDGNLKIVTNAAAYDMTMGTFGMSSGKWYWEGTWVSGDNRGWGVGTLSTPLNDYLGSNGSWGYMYTGVKVQPGNTQSSYGSAFTAGDIVSVAFDADIGAIWFAKNGVWQNSATASEIAQGTTTNAAFTGLTSGPYFPYTSNQSSATGTKIGNFGQRQFAYTPPTGFKSICTTNLPDPTIADGSDYFDTKLYTGNSSTQTISGYEFSPDLVWLKSRSHAYDHYLTDTVRGATKSLRSNSTAIEATLTQGLTAFTSDGFTVGTEGQFNNTGRTMVAWAWDAGSSNTTITAGSLNSTAYDQSQTWSSYITGTVDSNYPATNMFDGDSGTAYATGTKPATGTSLTWTPTTAITGVETLEIGIFGNQAFEVNGTSITPGSTGGQAVSVDKSTYFSNGTLSSISWEYTDSSNYVYMTYIKVNGKILTDSGVTPPNVPSIASTVRANQSAGFSIVSYTGTGSNATIGHGLNAQPHMVVFKNRDTTNDWVVIHKNLTGYGTYRINLNTTSGQSSAGASWFQSTAPTSSVISVGNISDVNSNNDNIIAYCFAPVEGYSAFGSYTGNVTANGAFVYTGMRPKFLLIKLSSSAGQEWVIYDTERDPVNAADTILQPNLADQEYTNTTYHIDILSNGFKIRGGNSRINSSGQTYIYAAFAENPFKYARAR